MLHCIHRICVVQVRKTGKDVWVSLSDSLPQIRKEAAGDFTSSHDRAKEPVRASQVRNDDQPERGRRGPRGGGRSGRARREDDDDLLPVMPEVTTFVSELVCFMSRLHIVCFQTTSCGVDLSVSAKHGLNALLIDHGCSSSIWMCLPVCDMQSSLVKHSSVSNFVHLYHRKNHSCSELEGCLQGKRHPAEALLSPRDEDREEAGQRRYGRRGADHVTPGPDGPTRGGRGRGRARGGRADRRDSSYSDNRGDSGQGSAAQSSRRAQPSKPKATEIAWKLFAADAKVSTHTAALLYLKCIVPCLLACLCSTRQTWKYTVIISQDLPDTAFLIHEHHSQ